MKSKSFDLKETPTQKGKLSRSFDFVGLYKTAEETNAKLQQNPKSVESFNGGNVSNSSVSTPGRERSPNKKRKKKNEPVDVSVINIDSGSLGARAAGSSPVDGSRVTSTPLVNRKHQQDGPAVKSIMKTSKVTTEDEMDTSAADSPVSKPKKRNKSVSFMLDDTEGVAVKKVKSEESLDKGKGKSKHKHEDKKKYKKIKKNVLAEKENNANINMETDKNDVSDKKTKIKEKSKPILADATADSAASDGSISNHEKKKKFKKIRKPKKTDDGSEPTGNESNNNDDTGDHKPKKLKKKKHHVKNANQPDTTETDGEPATKSRKKDVKPEIIAEDLENLNIGDNAHTLTGLLDEMTVVDKNKKKKNRIKRKKDKPKTVSVSSSETADLEKIEEGKEKVKWKKRKWNKDKKGDMDEESLVTTVIVENLPLKIMLQYKTLLAHHFESLGLIKRVGVAEVYPTEDSKPVFTTTITFYSEGAANKALEEDNTEFEGSRIRVKRPLPPTETTVVVRSYGDLTDQTLSSVFTSAGRIRNIRNLVKGRKSMATAFIEFDGPEAVNKALKIAEDARIGGKKLHVSKFEHRSHKRAKERAEPKHGQHKQPDSENEGDSEDSND